MKKYILLALLTAGIFYLTSCQSKSSRIPIREQLKKAAEQLVKEPPKTQERTKEVVREER